MKKILLFAIPGLLIVGCLVLFAHNGQFGFHGGHHQGMMEDFMLFRIEQMAKNLNLTPDQQAKLDTMKQSVSTMFDQGMQKRKTMHDTIQQELQKDNPDLTNITPLIDAQIDARAQNAHQMVQQFTDFYNTLTPDQKKTLAAQMLQHMSWRNSGSGQTGSGQTNPGQ